MVSIITECAKPVLWSGVGVLRLVQKSARLSSGGGKHTLPTLVYDLDLYW